MYVNQPTKRQAEILSAAVFALKHVNFYNICCYEFVSICIYQFFKAASALLWQAVGVNGCRTWR